MRFGFPTETPCSLTDLLPLLHIILNFPIVFLIVSPPTHPPNTCYLYPILVFKSPQTNTFLGFSCQWVSRHQNLTLLYLAPSHVILKLAKHLSHILLLYSFELSASMYLSYNFFSHSWLWFWKFLLPAYYRQPCQAVFSIREPIGAWLSTFFAYFFHV
jgi:hypothetical protein